MNKPIALAACGLAVVGVILLVKKASSSVSPGDCFTLNNIGTGPDEPYYYARWLGASMALTEAFGSAANDVFTVQYQALDWQDVTSDTIVERNQLIRFQVVRETIVCGFDLEEAA